MARDKVELPEGSVETPKSVKTVKRVPSIAENVRQGAGEKNKGETLYFPYLYSASGKALVELTIDKAENLVVWIADRQAAGDTMETLHNDAVKAVKAYRERHPVKAMKAALPEYTPL